MRIYWKYHSAEECLIYERNTKDKLERLVYTLELNSDDEQWGWRNWESDTLEAERSRYTDYDTIERIPKREAFLEIL